MPYFHLAKMMWLAVAACGTEISTGRGQKFDLQLNLRVFRNPPFLPAARATHLSEARASLGDKRHGVGRLSDKRRRQIRRVIRPRIRAAEIGGFRTRSFFAKIQMRISTYVLAEAGELELEQAEFYCDYCGGQVPAGSKFFILSRESKYTHSCSKCIDSVRSWVKPLGVNNDIAQ
jgi:hypothetical protein